MESAATVKITDKKTGESRLYYDTAWHLAGHFYYEDGNGSCDCNRSLYFQYAHGVAPKDAEDYECGEGRFIIESVFHEGAIVYSELEGTNYA